jgi:hypothetical protein
VFIRYEVNKPKGFILKYFVLSQKIGSTEGGISFLISFHKITGNRWESLMGKDEHRVLLSEAGVLFIEGFI